MRALLLLILIIPVTSYGIGSDSCWFEGDVNGKKVKLKWIDLGDQINIYGLRDSPIYGFCTTDRKSEGLYNMSCAATRDGKQTVYYETLIGDNIAQSTYMCKSGCVKNIVKKFIMVCGSY